MSDAGAKPPELIPGLQRGWVDQLWHDMKAQGRAKLAVPEPDWQQPGRSKPALTPDHRQRMREGLQRYHERRRAAKGSK